MEWIKTQLALAKNGDASARRKLLASAVLLAVLVTLLVTGQSSSQPIEVHQKTSNASAVDQASGYVHISGGVVHPGVYAINSGMRLFELIALAGGFTRKADQSSVNLARVVVDGEQVLVGSGQVENHDNLIYLNKATATELDSLPGIGPTLSQRIIDWRQNNGPFSSIDELRKVGGIGDKLFAAIKPLVGL